MSEELIIPAIISGGIFLLVMLFAVFAERSKGAQGRIRKIAETEPAFFRGESKDPMMDSLYSTEKSGSLAAFFSSLLKLTGTNVDKFRRESQMRFYRAGITSPDAAVYYLIFKRVGLIVFPLLAYAVATLPGAGMTRMMHYMVGLILLVLGVFGADLYINNGESKRKKVLQNSFPDALDLLLVCVESGLALDGALSRVCKELGRAYPEITEELNRTRLELTLLNDRAQALQNLAERTDLLSFRALTTTLLQSEKFGTSLTDTLRVLSEDFRNTRLMLAEEKAGRLPVLMTVPLIMLMMPALFLIILGPTIIRAMGLSLGGS